MSRSSTRQALQDSLARVRTAQLRNYRATRYRSTEQAIPLTTFPTEYRGLFAALYADLRTLEMALETDEPVSSTLEPVAERLSQFSLSARELRARIDLNEQLARAVHDIRGGALSALLLELQSCISEIQPEPSGALKILVHDHMKIMRNLIEGIDENARQSDLARRPHSLAALAKGLQSFLVASEGDSAAAQFEVEDQALVADSCVEFTALERAAYNVLNNAVTHAGKSQIEMSVAVIEGHLRFAVGNDLRPEMLPLLSAKLAEDAAGLFGTFSTTGSGHGLRIVADLVGNAYGVTSLDELVAEGYIGTAVVNERFVAWMHWPVLA